MTKRILLADDSLTIQKVVELTFSDSDYELLCVSNGQRALEKVRESRPDLILADAVMPEKNGYEVCEAIKGDPATARIPVILLSGTFEPFDRERAERIGADAIVSKPFDSQQLLAQVDALLDRAPGASASSSEPFPVPQTTSGIAIPPEPEAREAPEPKSSSSEEAPFDTGFSAEDFTASIRKPPARAGVDPFEEEYGARGDVESAIEAFEKAHPEAAGAASAEPADEPAADEEAEPAREPLASWLRDEPEKPAAYLQEPVLSERTAPLALSADPFDSGVASPVLGGASPAAAQPPGWPAMMGFSNLPPDEMPTLELPQMKFDRGGPSAGDRAPETPAFAEADSEPGAPASRDSKAVEISAKDAEDLFDVGGGSAPAGAEAPSRSTEPLEDEAAPASPSGEIEMLAQRSSIPELTQMLSSVRGINDMTDEQIERLATRVVEKLSDRVVREIAWEVIPDMAEIVIKQRIKELESGIE